MQSGSFWAYREAAELPDYDPQEPDFTSLWDKSHVARRSHLCTVCGEEIASGSRYRSIGFIMDGRFEAQKVHGVVGFPSTCPKFAERDRRELAEQFEKDRAKFFPAESGAGVAAAKQGASVLSATEAPKSSSPLNSAGGEP